MIVLAGGQCPQVATTTPPMASSTRRRNQPRPAPGSAKGSPCEFDQDEERDDCRDVGQDHENAAEGELRQAAVEKPARDEAKGDESDRGCKPEESLGAVPAEEDDQQNQMCRESQCPENLDRGEIEIQMHGILSEAAFARASGPRISLGHRNGSSEERRKGRIGAPGEIRTPDLTLRRRSLYPAELRARSISIPYFSTGELYPLAAVSRERPDSRCARNSSITD